jgi:hypothetical protein
MSELKAPDMSQQRPWSSAAPHGWLEHLAKQGRGRAKMPLSFKDALSWLYNNPLGCITFALEFNI